ncbi:MAG TPA: hypothetical protein DDY14_13025 [Chromatiaceae bacterium]|nr:MAG: hypothetical protein N838_19745 [Thiohalocapsa sp. PB-PSB1]HBG96203.1 hypothetical protein [Chromatiaceae bacterium]HCS89057.1 hypothetical protein [Chromatiaceae bacterium]
MLCFGADDQSTKPDQSTNRVRPGDGTDEERLAFRHNNAPAALRCRQSRRVQAVSLHCADRNRGLAMNHGPSNVKINKVTKQ